MAKKVVIIETGCIRPHIEGQYFEYQIFEHVPLRES